MLVTTLSATAASTSGCATTGPGHLAAAPATAGSDGCQAAAHQACYDSFLAAMLTARGGPLPDADGVEACLSRALAACAPRRALPADLLAASTGR